MGCLTHTLGRLHVELLGRCNGGAWAEAAAECVVALSIVVFVEPVRRGSGDRYLNSRAGISSAQTMLSMWFFVCDWHDAA